MHRNSELLFKKHAAKMFKDGMRVLEIGPSGTPSIFEKIVNNNAITWETLDLNPFLKNTYIASSEYVFPIGDNTFDVVFSGQVIEHVREIWVWIKEISRVCKPGGFIITISPVNWPYHEAPYDCWRIYPEGMRALYKNGGLKIILCCREALDKPPNGIGYGLSCVCKILKHPSYFLKRFVYGYQEWHPYMAEDVITIGKKP